jgi:hypothetical protein
VHHRCGILTNGKRPPPGVQQQHGHVVYVSNEFVHLRVFWFVSEKEANKHWGSALVGRPSHLQGAGTACASWPSFLALPCLSVCLSVYFFSRSRLERALSRSVSLSPCVLGVAPGIRMCGSVRVCARDMTRVYVGVCVGMGMGVGVCDIPGCL